MVDTPASDTLNRQICLASRPSGMPVPDDFSLVATPLQMPGPGQFLVRHHYIGLSPSVRLRMQGDTSYGAGMVLGSPVQGQSVGEICLSNHPGFTVGDYVVVNGGWQEFSISSGKTALRVDPLQAPMSAALGVLGTSGMTGFVGLLDIGRPQKGETLVVTAASGSVGSVVGQIARIKGCHVVGIAGGAEKCDYVTGELGFDACLDHTLPELSDRLAAACPDGIDILFENVGGTVRDAAWPLLNDFGRVVLCGLIAEYQDAGQGAGPNWFPILTRRLTVRGFLLRDHADRREKFTRAVSQWYREGRIKYREDITVGLEKTPEAFIRLLQGRNFGKSIVRVING
jgi:NADPH-dependent curcumin reductase CurA